MTAVVSVSHMPCADCAAAAAHGTHAAGLHRQSRELCDGHGAVAPGLHISALRRQLQHCAGVYLCCSGRCALTARQLPPVCACGQMGAWRRQL